ncbi:UNVERIFIED_CONTAM: hypothetical protein K2H54_048416 [Gekko kuhli]
MVSLDLGASAGTERTSWSNGPHGKARPHGDKMDTRPSLLRRDLRAVAESRESRETWGLRVHEVCKAPQAHPGNQDAGGTEASTAWLDCLGKRGIGVNPVLLVPQGPQVKMGRGVMMEKLAPEVSLGNL